MANWKYTLNSGSALREAIDNDDMEQVVKCLLLCYKELKSKLSEEDEEWYADDITDAMDSLDFLDSMGVEDEDEDEINDHLEDFYDLCDALRAWIGI